MKIFFFKWYKDIVTGQRTMLKSYSKDGAIELQNGQKFKNVDDFSLLYILDDYVPYYWNW